MKQLLFMVLSTAYGTVGSFAIGPHVGLTVYFLFAVMRPQFIWEWSLSNFGLSGFAWSYYVAMAALAATIITAPGKPRHRLQFPHFAVWGLAIWVTLSFLMARNREFAQQHYTEIVKIFVMFTAATWGIRSLSHLWALLVTITLADIYIALEVNQYYFLDGYMFLARQGFGGLDNNGAALQFAMGVPLCYFLWESTPQRWRWGYVLGIALLGHAVLLSFSRGAMLSLIVTCPLLLILSQHKRKVIVFLALAFAVVVVTAGPDVKDRFLSISKHDADESANSRKTSWMIAIRMANEEPLFGFGVRNSVLYTRAYGADMEGRAIHSMYLQLAADAGWVGMGCFLVVLGSTWFVCARTWWRLRGRDDPDAVRTQTIAAAVAYSLAVYSFGAIFLSLDTFEMPYILVLIGAQLASLGTPAGPTHATTQAVAPLVVGWPYPWLPLNTPLR